MEVHQAIFGNERGGHALLKFSGGEKELYAALTTRTDLPGTPPPGVTWLPYVSGFAFRDFFVLLKTFPDVDAARGGMVMSHAILLPAAAVADINDLALLLRLLPEQPNKNAALATLHVPEKGARSEVPTSLSQSVIQLANSIVVPGKLPIVWVGQEQFEEAITAIWAGLSPPMRLGIKFRLSFGPQDCQEETPTFIATPKILESRWAGFRVISENESGLELSDAAAAVLDLVEGRRLRDLCNQLGADLRQLTDFGRLADCEKLSSAKNLSIYELISLIRLIAYLSPERASGIEFKNEILARLIHALPELRAEDILLMRNLEVAAFSNGIDLWRGLQDWAGKIPFSRFNDDSKILDVWKEAAAGPRTAWKDAIWKGFDEAIILGQVDFSRAIWHAWTTAPLLTDVLAEHIGESAQNEIRLVGTAPTKLELEPANRVMSLARNKGWLSLHAVTVAAALTPAQAIEKQLAVDVDPAHSSGIQLAARKATPLEVIAAALRFRDTRLVTLASEACTTSPSLLEQFSARDPVWRQIFMHVLSKRSDAWQFLQNTAALIENLISLSVGTTEPPLDLWNALTATPLLDVSAHPRRRLLWKELPSAVVAFLLRPTVEGWFRRFCNDPQLDGDVEPELQPHLTDESRYWKYIDPTGGKNVEIAVHFFRRFISLTESHFNRWLRCLMFVTSATRGITPSDSMIVGRLVMERHWISTAKSLAAEGKKRRPDLRPAIQECYELIGNWDRIVLWRAGALREPRYTADDLWRIFERLAGELYSKGPEDSEIWSRADGDVSKLDLNGDGQSQWHSALRRLRNGGGGDIQPKWLLKAMSRDYTWNEELRWLAEQDEFK